MCRDMIVQSHSNWSVEQWQCGNSSLAVCNRAHAESDNKHLETFIEICYCLLNVIIKNRFIVLGLHYFLYLGNHFYYFIYASDCKNYIKRKEKNGRKEGKDRKRKKETSSIPQTARENSALADMCHHYPWAK